MLAVYFKLVAELALVTTGGSAPWAKRLTDTLDVCTRPVVAPASILVGWLVLNKHQLSRKRIHYFIQLGLCSRTRR